MNNTNHCLLIAVLSLTGFQVALADEPERDGRWVIERPDGKYIRTAELTVHPAAEPKPALKYKLLPDPYDQVEGNSAIYYLKAMGFLEQEPAHQRHREFLEKNRKLADEKGLELAEVPPHVWLSMPPKQLPVDEVKAYLDTMDFQRPLLAEATLRKEFTLDRYVRKSPSPVATLLPEIQAMRDVARTQSLRCRLAIAEHRIEEAIQIVQQQFAMARHLASDEFVIANLVGAAVVGITFEDLTYLLEEPDAPNLYWALAALPRPLIDMNRSMPMERHLFDMQLKALQEVDETPRAAGYWQELVDRLLVQLRDLEIDNNRWRSADPQVERATFVSMIAAAYPGAKRYLIEECQIDRSRVDAYPTAQVVFLAMKRFNEQTVDNKYKWNFVPYHQALSFFQFQNLDEEIKQDISSQRFGWASIPTNTMLVSIKGLHNSRARVQQNLYSLQTVEAIRMYGANHAGQLPKTLAELPYPVPNDPISDKPFDYSVSGDECLVSGQPLPYLQNRFRIRFAK